MFCVREFCLFGCSSGRVLVCFCVLLGVCVGVVPSLFLVCIGLLCLVS